MLKGKITKGVGGLYNVNTEQGLYMCKARGLFRKDGITPLIGDIVDISIVDEERGEGYIQDIYPRRNELVRPRVANVDCAIVVFAIKSPAVNYRLLDSLLIAIEAAGVDVLLCINKIDLDKRKKREELVTAYSKAGYPVLPISAAEGEGLEDVKMAVRGKTAVLAGPSGVGKSSLLNALCPALSLETGGLSRKTDRGRHTTRHTELIPIDEHNTCFVDSPGFTSISLDSIPAEDIRNYYPEFRRYQPSCYYGNCLHFSEHDCAVKEHVGAEIDEGRYERYIAILQEIISVS